MILIRLILTGILFNLFFIPISFANILYPIQEMSRPECRFQNFNTLNGDCKMELPVLKTTDIQKYKNDYSLYRRVYTVLHGASYTYGWDVGKGGHSGIDIATARGTPVVSVAPGKVVSTGFLAGWGNNVKIEHTINGRNIYTNYSHLDKINVKKGDRLSAGQKLGTVGSTGNSTGNHLHFQIDLVSYGNAPWYRRNCSGHSYNSIVNDGVCRSELLSGTLDPLSFFETNGAIVSVPDLQRPTAPVVERDDIMTREEIERREIEDFLRNYNVSLSVRNFGKNILLGETGTIRVSVTSRRNGRPFSGSFPGFMNFNYDNSKFGLFPVQLLAIDNGFRDIKVTPKVEGNYRVGVNIGSIELSSVTFSIIDGRKPIDPTGVSFGRSVSNVAGQNRKGILFLRNRNNSNILGTPFAGNLKLTSRDKNMLFCIKKANSLQRLNFTFNSDCNEDDFKKSVDFNYQDTLEGLLIFDYKVLDHGNAYANVIKSNGQNLTNTLFRGTLPRGLTNKHPYYNELIDIGKAGILTGINGGFYLEDRVLNHMNGLDMIKNTLKELKSRCKNNSCNNLIDGYINKANQIQPNRFKNLSRVKFLDMMGDLLPLRSFNGDSMDFRDISGDSQDFADKILRGKTWKDQFGSNRYFQPNKNITRGEAVYLIYNVLN